MDVFTFLQYCIGYAILLILAAIIVGYYVSIKTYVRKDSFRIRSVKGLKSYF